MKTKVSFLLIIDTPFADRCFICKMPQNKYLFARTLLLSGEVKTLSDLLAIIDKTPFSRDIKTTPERFNRMLDNHALFRLGDIYNMAQVIGVDDKLLLDLVYNDFVKKKKGKG